MTYKRIMVAIDGSETSTRALKEAIHIATSFKAKLGIIHVADEFPLHPYLHAAELLNYQELVRNAGKHILHRMKEMAEKHHIEPDILLAEIIDCPEFVSEKIIETAVAWQADLLVIGTHGRRGVRRFLFGSVAEETIRISPIPVLLVHSNVNDDYCSP